MRLPKIRELIEAIKALIKGPYTSKFPGQPHQAHPNFRGQPKFNEEKCVGCAGCKEVCPVEAIDYLDLPNDKSNPRRVMIHYTDTCIFCGQCEAVCIADNEGIKLSNDWELSFFDRSKSDERIEKKLQLCEVCGEAIACCDHLEWIVKKIGELSFSNPTLYLPRLKRLGIIDENIISALADQGRPPSLKLRGTVRRSLGEGGRSDRVKILCASCRRDTTLTT